MAAMNILVTGPPGSGKSTLIERVAQQLKQPLSGFLTREMRREGRRVGFSIITFDGQERVLAHQEIASGFRVGGYGINMEDLDRITLPERFSKRWSR